MAPRKFIVLLSHTLNMPQAPLRLFIPRLFALSPAGIQLKDCYRYIAYRQNEAVAPERKSERPIWENACGCVPQMPLCPECSECDLPGHTIEGDISLSGRRP